MIASTTRGIRIEVISKYESHHSLPAQEKFVHSYQITIRNTGRDTVQLLRRHWIITDSSATIREVKGDGVIGLQPIIESNQSHTYTSWCPLNSEVGKMSGSYTMINLVTNEYFEVVVPEFPLIADYVLN